ncbi:uncharacterized protein V6R79_025658 [Siganus canaliculatus]
MDGGVGLGGVRLWGEGEDPNTRNPRVIFPSCSLLDNGGRCIGWEVKAHDACGADSAAAQEDRSRFADCCRDENEERGTSARNARNRHFLFCSDRRDRAGGRGDTRHS